MLAQKAFNAARTPPDCSVMHDDSSLKHGGFLTPCEIGAVTGLFLPQEVLQRRSITPQSAYVQQTNSVGVRFIFLRMEDSMVTRRLLEDAGLRAGMQVLDVGCGPGDVSLLAAELVGEQGSVIGVDTNASVLQIAQARAQAAGLRPVSFLCRKNF
jgi:2-polyprenyl-3-methyl-5-hydroxy-6-metoxy-1,4-benzoquinol methylase